MESYFFAWYPDDKGSISGENLYNRKKTRIFLVLAICLVFSSSVPGQANSVSDTTLSKNSVKLDFIPFYYDFFDTRVQARIGLEYERQRTKMTFLSLYLDIGLYDYYDYIKYYDFFNENEGFHSKKQSVSITGFHLVPGYNSNFLHIKKKRRFSCFAGSALDVSVYKKKYTLFNSLDNSKVEEKYYQYRMGIGAGMGMQYWMGKHLMVEIKSFIFVKVFNHLTQEGTNPVMALNAQWTSIDYHLWWVNQLKFGYVF